MRRFVTAFIVVLAIQGLASAQDSFRFSTDTPENTEGAVANSGEADNAETESYQSWPSADGRSAVQKKAQFRAEQRQLRIASRQWYGFSQSRPTVAAVPYMTNYHPVWVGRYWHPYHSWYGTVWR